MPIKDENYIVMQGWMKNDYGLTGDDLTAFAIINGFSHDGAGWYVGGRAYIAEWLGCSEKKAGSILQRLTDAGYVKRVEMKGEKGWKTYRYRVLIGAKNDRINDSNGGEIGQSMGAENAHININRNIKENKGSEEEGSSDIPKAKNGKNPSSPCPKCGGKLFKNTQNGRIECSQCFEYF